MAKVTVLESRTVVHSGEVVFRTWQKLCQTRVQSDQRDTDCRLLTEFVKFS